MQNHFLKRFKLLMLALALTLTASKATALSCGIITPESTSERYQNAYFVGKMRVLSVSDEAGSSIGKGFELPARPAEIALSNDIRPSMVAHNHPKQASVLLHEAAAKVGTDWFVIIDDEKTLKSGAWRSARLCGSNAYESATQLYSSLLPKAAVHVQNIHPDLLARMDKHFGLPLASLLELKLQKLKSMQDHTVVETILLKFDSAPNDRHPPRFHAQDLTPGVYRLSRGALDAKLGKLHLKQRWRAGAAPTHPERPNEHVFTLEDRGLAWFEIVWEAPLHLTAVPGFAGGSATAQLPHIFHRADKDADGSVQHPYHAWPKANYLIKYHGADGKADYPAMRMGAGDMFPVLAGYYSLSASWRDAPKTLMQTQMQYKEGLEAKNGLFYLKPNDRANDHRPHAIYFPYYQDDKRPNQDPAVPKWVTMGFDFTNLLGQAIAVEGISAFSPVYDELGKIIGQSSVFGVNKPPSKGLYVRGLEGFGYSFGAYALEADSKPQKTIRTKLSLDFTDMQRTLRLE